MSCTKFHCDCSEPSDEECDCTEERFCTACGRLMQLQTRHPCTSSSDTVCECSCECSCKSTRPRQHHGSCNLWNTNTPPRTTPSMEEKFIQLVEKWSRETHGQSGESHCDGSVPRSRSSCCSCKESLTRQPSLERSTSRTRKSRSGSRTIGLSIPLDEDPSAEGCQCPPNPGSLKLWKGITLKLRIGSKGVVGSPEVTVKDRKRRDNEQSDVEGDRTTQSNQALDYLNEKEEYDSDDEIFYVKKLKAKNKQGEGKHSRVSIEEPELASVPGRDEYVYKSPTISSGSLIPLNPSAERICPDPDPCPYRKERTNISDRGGENTHTQSTSSANRGLFHKKSKHSSFSENLVSNDGSGQSSSHFTGKLVNDPYYQGSGRIPSHTSNLSGQPDNERMPSHTSNLSGQGRDPNHHGSGKMPSHTSNLSGQPDNERILSHTSNLSGQGRDLNHQGSGRMPSHTSNLSGHPDNERIPSHTSNLSGQGRDPSHQGSGRIPSHTSNLSGQPDNERIPSHTSHLSGQVHDPNYQGNGRMPSHTSNLSGQRGNERMASHTSNLSGQPGNERMPSHTSNISGRFGEGNERIHSHTSKLSEHVDQGNDRMLSRTSNISGQQVVEPHREGSGRIPSHTSNLSGQQVSGAPHKNNVKDPNSSQSHVSARSDGDIRVATNVQ